MQITHFLNEKNQEKKEGEEVSFLISNKRGDYLWLNENLKSRYEGWFCRFEKQLYRIIESIEVDGEEKILEIRNEFNCFKRKRESFWETFFLPENTHTFTYELSEKRKTDVFFDARESYSSDDLLDYDIEKEGDFFVIRFKNGLFLIILAEKCENKKNVIFRNYSFDEKRNSPPFGKNIFHGVSLYGKKFIFSVSRDKEIAKKEATKIFVKNSLKTEELDVLCAKNSLSNLFIFHEKGLYAGLPWFFQFWPRDEAISLKSFLEIDFQNGKEIFFRLLEEGIKNGPGGVVNTDALGWTFKRAEDILPYINIAEREMIRRYLKKYIEESLWAFTEGGFATNNKKETWMDSIDRSGARIEMQAMRLNMYHLASSLSKRRREKNLYKKMEKEMYKKVKEVYFDGKNLCDGYYPRKKVLHKKIRPNVFIAAYIYPQLLSKREWITVFDNTLNALWLSWGGVASVEKEAENFSNEHTGEVPRSYHQGDSWFFLNNLVAVVLHRFDRKRYENYIKKIMEASREEMMWKGAVGCHGEVSSAKELRSEGCPNQAWSSAMYLEMKREVRSFS